MKSKILFLLIFLLLITCVRNYSQQSHLTETEQAALFKAFQEDSLFAEFCESRSNALKLYAEYESNVSYSDSLWNDNQQRLLKIKDFGYTRKFEFIPLIENICEKSEFKTAIGVSYLIRTDNSTILFDTGWDEDSLMCVFRYNLEKLGIDIKRIDAVVISHNHDDHQNGWKWTSDKTFLDPEDQSILPGIKVYVPDNKLNLKIQTIFSQDPVKIAEGVYTTGIIRAPLFFLATQEQALLINVKDKGIVIVTGCGHQTVDKLIERCETLTDLPVYAILGGLHLPVYGDSEKYLGYVVTGKLPWEPLTLSDVNKKIDLIKKKQIQLIGISTHDSSDKTIQAFKKAFTSGYKDLKTGEWIIVD
jgi:7,8-dihydropterin-6-yl-methyl-4-(beta-D-ribofuranosyl)aminobenzene 5'-phosphate synthase